MEKETKTASEVLHDEVTDLHSKLIINTPHLEEFIIDAMVNYHEYKIKPFLASFSEANNQNTNLLLENAGLQVTISQQADLLRQAYEKLTLCRPHVAGLGPIVYNIKNYKDYQNYKTEKETLEKWNDVSIEPEFGGEYNVYYDLGDGEPCLVTTMEYDKIKKVWIDVICHANSICNTVILWKELPKVPDSLVKKPTIDQHEHRKHIQSLDDFERLAYGQCSHGENMINCNICNPDTVLNLIK